MIAAAWERQCEQKQELDLRGPALRKGRQASKQLKNVLFHHERPSKGAKQP
jgi:hypothetical protein